MTNPAGYRLQGREIDPTTGVLIGVLGSTDIRVLQQLDDATATSEIGMALNLQSDAQILTWDAANPSTTSNFSSSITVYDSQGERSVVTIYFNRTGDDAWGWHAFEGTTDLGTTGSLTFDATGQLLPIVPPPSLTVNGQPVTLGFANTTQNASASSIINQSQNGFPPGTLMNVTVSPEGIVEGRYSNGQIRALFQIDLANFNNPWGLSREGGNLFAETLDSGEALINLPGTSGLGKISPNSLEQSNVDLASEFVKMIIAQRGFQANSKVITTTDEMLADLMMIKR
jgi:flagellar hook protein FlgE